MNNLTYETRNGKRCAVCSPVNIADIDRITAGMITRNSIPGLAEIRYYKLDDMIHFYYDVTDCVFLSDWLCENAAQEKKIEMMKQIARIFSAADDWMIDVKYISGEVDTVFVNEHTGSPIMLCLPVTNTAADQSKSLMAAIAEKLDRSELGVDGISELEEFFNSEHFEWGKLPAFLDKMMQPATGVKPHVTATDSATLQAEAELIGFVKNVVAEEADVTPRKRFGLFRKKSAPSKPQKDINADPIENRKKRPAGAFIAAL